VVVAVESIIVKRIMMKPIEDPGWMSVAGAIQPVARRIAFPETRLYHSDRGVPERTSSEHIQ